jgi:hypothetical protein
MGGAVILQSLHQTNTGDFVEGVFLDAPVVDWGDVLATTPGSTTSRPRCATSARWSWAGGRRVTSSGFTTRSTSR